MFGELTAGLGVWRQGGCRGKGVEEIRSYPARKASDK